MTNISDHQSRFASIDCIIQVAGSWQNHASNFLYGCSKYLLQDTFFTG
jgi:hypothetical protein